MTRRRQLEHQLELKRQHNANASVSKLPLEILVEVFAIVNANNRLEVFHRVLQVCQHWRLAAIGAPFLWTHPPAEHHHYTLLMLERSKTAPLTIRIHPGTRMATVKAILKHSQRIRSLRCVLNTRTLNSIQKLLLDLPPMPLEELTILPQYDASRNFRLNSAAFCPPDHLRRIVLTTIDLDWNLICVSSLRDLQLNFMCMSAGVTWDQLLGLLRDAPLLETLSITMESLLTGQHSPGTRAKPIPLQYLQLLSLTYGSEDQIKYMLAHVVCPQLCDLRVGCNFSETDSADYTDIIQAISDTLEAGNFGSGLEALEIDGVFFFELFIGESPGTPAAPFLQIQLPYGGDRDADMRIFSKVLTGLSVLRAPEDDTSSVTQLSLRMPFGPTELVELFGRLPRLRTIIASEGSVYEIIPSLKIARDHPRERPIPFPKLESLTLSIVDMEYDEPEIWDNLADVLAQRCKHGAKIRELALEGRTTVGIPELAARFSTLASNVVVSDLQPLGPAFNRRSLRSGGRGNRSRGGNGNVDEDEDEDEDGDSSTQDSTDTDEDE